jgi:hypothetical protein
MKKLMILIKILSFGSTTLAVVELDIGMQILISLLFVLTTAERKFFFSKWKKIRKLKSQSLKLKYTCMYTVVISKEQMHQN